MQKEHILQKSVEEIEKSKSFREELRNTSSGFLYVLQTLFRNNLKKTFQKYAQKKNDILMKYSSLYSDIQKDILSNGVSSQDTMDIQESLLYISQSIEECGYYLKKMLAYTQREKEILTQEKYFFMQLMKSFNSDVHVWLKKHAEEIGGEVSEIDTIQKMSTLESEKAVLELQKKRLQSHRENISNI